MNKCDQIQHVLISYFGYFVWTLSENEVSIQLKDDLSDTIQIDKSKQLCNQINYLLPRELL